jgi:hypothetical protein
MALYLAKHRDNFTFALAMYVIVENYSFRLKPVIILMNQNCSCAKLGTTASTSSCVTEGAT